MTSTCSLKNDFYLFSLEFLQITDLQKNRMELEPEETKQIYQAESNAAYRNFITGLVNEAISKNYI